MTKTNNNITNITNITIAINWWIELSDSQKKNIFDKHFTNEFFKGRSKGKGGSSVTEYYDCISNDSIKRLYNTVMRQDTVIK